VHLDPPEATSFPQPPLFFWLPIDDQRHTAGIQDRITPPGKLITTLCGRQLTRTRVTGAEWRWLGCLECWSAAEAHVELHASTMPNTEGNQT
jgi:zinc-finger